MLSCPNSRVNHGNEDSLWRKTLSSVRENKSGGPNVMFWNLMGYVNYVGVGIDRENDSFHCPNKIVFLA